MSAGVPRRGPKLSMRWRATLLCGALLFASGAQAYERTGRIEGTIYDDEGNPLAGAQVRIRSRQQIGGSRSATTDEQGYFRFLNLIPGTFRVTVNMLGFIGAKRAGLRVEVGRTITLDILLDRVAESPPAAVPETRSSTPPGSKAGTGAAGEARAAGPGDAAAKRPRRAEAPRRSGAETYVITAERPVVDVTQATTGENLSDEYMAHMPVSGRSYQGVAGLTRNVTQRRNPKGGAGGNPSIAGGAYFNNTYTVDGMETTDPVTHTFGTNFNFDAMSSVQILTGGMGPEFSDTPGGVLNMVTKSGSNTLELDASLYYQDDSLTIKRPEEIGRDFSSFDFNLNLGGPIIRDRLWYYTSFELNHRLSTLPPDPDGELPLHPSRRYFGFKGFAKLTYQVNPRHKLVAWFQTDPATISNSRQVITVTPAAERHQNQYGTTAVAAWEWLASNELFVKAQAGFNWSRLSVFPESGIFDQPRIRDVGSGVEQQNDFRSTGDDRFRISLHSSGSYFLKNRFGDHEIRGGMRFHHVFNPSEESVAGHQEFLPRFGQPFSRARYYVVFQEATLCDPNHRDYDPLQCRQGTLSTEVSGNKLIAFLQDTWRLPSYRRLRLIPGAALHFGNSINPDGEEVTRFVAGTLHFNVAWDPFGDSKTVLRGGYNQYVDTGFLSIARFVGRDLIQLTCNYDHDVRDFVGNCRVGGQTRTVGVPRPEFDADGGVVQQFNPDALTVPRVHELSVGAERQWLPGFATGIDFQYRRYDHQWEDLETNVLWNELGDDTAGFKNGESEFIFDLETPEQAYRRYVSLSFFARRFVGHWQLMASYTWSRSEGTVAESFATVFLDRARQVPFFEGPMPDDRRHVFKLTGFYRFADYLTVGGSIWIGSGTPYDKLFFNRFFNDYQDRRAPRGVDPRDPTTPDDDVELRTPTRLAFDLKVTYHLQHLMHYLIGERHNLELVGEVFNLFNLRTATRFEDRNLDPGAPTQFGETIDRQSPFSVRFGLRYRY